MTLPGLDSFFAGGGGKSVSWKDKPLGSTVGGTIKTVHPPVQQTDPKDGSLQFKKNGEPKVSVRIDLSTDFRAFEMCKPPDDPNETDDGDRALYVQGFMQGAIGDALRKAGAPPGPPQAGGQLYVKLVERTPNDNPVLSPINKFEAVYVPPAAAATADFFGAGGTAPVMSTATGTPVVHQQAVPGSPQYQAPPAAVAPEPSRPPSIPEASWAAMSPETKQQVAASLADLPPF